MIIKLTLLATAVSGVADYAIKYAADHQSPWLAAMASLLWLFLAVVWYHLYQLDKFMVLSMYFMVIAIIKDALISQVLVGESLTAREIAGCAMVICGAITMATRG